MVVVVVVVVVTLQLSLSPHTRTGFTRHQDVFISHIKLTVIHFSLLNPLSSSLLSHMIGDDQHGCVVL